MILNIYKLNSVFGDHNRVLNKIQENNVKLYSWSAEEFQEVMNVSKMYAIILQTDCMNNRKFDEIHTGKGTA